jgi:hypothetical protein
MDFEAGVEIEVAVDVPEVGVELDVEAEVEVEVEAEVEVEVAIDVPEVEIDVELEAEAEVEIEVEIDSDPLAAQVEVEVEIDVPQVEVEVEVDIEVPQVEVEIDMPVVGIGFGTSDAVNVEFELEADPMVEVEVDIQPEVEIQIDIPQVELQAQALISTDELVTINAKPAKMGPSHSQKVEVDLLSKDPESIQPFLQKIWIWLAMQAGIPFVVCSVLMCLPLSWFATLLTMPYYAYFWDGLALLLMIVVLSTLSKCTQSCFCGFAIWFVVLLLSLTIFSLNCMRRLDDEGSSSVIFLGMLFSMLCGMCAYSRTKAPTYETCTTIPYLVLPQFTFAILVCMFYSYKSSYCITYMVLITLFALTCKGSARLILDGEKFYATNQSVAASQKMYTDFFSVFGHFLHAFYRKSEDPREINFVFN